MTDRPCDALIIGGGPAGASVAQLLSKNGWNCIVVERKTFPRRKVCGEYLSVTNGALLEKLGVAESFRDYAGPAITDVGLFAGTRTIRSALPSCSRSGNEWGRALPREQLDSLLLDRARASGAEVLQHWSAEAIESERGGFTTLLKHRSTREILRIHSRIVILAHGSWDRSGLASQSESTPNRPSDLLAFKAHFSGGTLPDGLMPLLAFPGGYGGMVHVGDNRFSVSCCIRRDRLEHVRDKHRDCEAGVAVERFLGDSMLGFRQALGGASRDGDWIAAGPIRPGVRLRWQPGLYPIGNAAGEAHPIIAEGISMAMQSAWLLSRRLNESKANRLDLHNIGIRYAKDWRRAFVSRLRVSQALAHWAMNPIVLGSTLPFLRLLPGLLTWGARLTGKVHRVVRVNSRPLFQTSLQTHYTSRGQG